jgi:5-methylcytosine-specific restriction protein A
MHYENICKAAASYFESMEHVYGFKFNETNVKYSILLSTNMTSTDTPSVKTIYELINTLRKVLKEKGENPLDSPMLNTTRIETNLISTTVAIPIQHQFEVSGNIRMKNMVLGRILETPVNGGVNEIKKAFDIDHIIPLAEGGTNEQNNLQVLCKKCHFEKTQTEHEQGYIKLSLTESSFNTTVKNIFNSDLNSKHAFIERLKETIR